MIWASFLSFSVLAAVIVLFPLAFRRSVGVSTEEVVPAVLLDQLNEIERDLDRGLISPAEASGAKLEINRRILTESRIPKQVDGARAEGGRALIIFAALFVPAVAFGYYAAFGSPRATSLAFAERPAERDQVGDVATLAQKLFDRLSNDPGGGPSEGWQLLGQTYMRLGRLDDAVAAFETISDRDDATSATLSMLAEALISDEQGIVTLRAEAAINRALELDPSNPAGAFYKAVSMAQNGDEGGAHDLLVSRLNASDEFAPWMEAFVAEANRIASVIGRPALSLANFAQQAAPGPSSADVAAAQDMSDAERTDFIQSMVERLASRLEDEPNDLEGWMRLANAHAVLGDRGKAIAAYEKADGLLGDAPAHDSRRTQIRKAIADLKG
jgi:cytochrome c-type biogenesis protein CcmH